MMSHLIWICAVCRLNNIIIIFFWGGGGGGGGLWVLNFGFRSGRDRLQPLTLKTPVTKIAEFENSLDPDEAAHNEPPVNLQTLIGQTFLSCLP